MKKRFNNYLKLIRIKHYIKNLLIFIPLFFSGFYSQNSNIVICTVGFFLFCFVSSIIYILNDLADIEKDKLHETKKNRPLASGEVSKKEAISIALILAVATFFMMMILMTLKANLYSLLLPLVYIAINVLYSVGFKNVVLLDVVILVSGFLIRLFFGAVLIDAEVSNWLYLTVMSGAFYMGFGKRRNEILRSKSNTRNVLKNYSKDFLDKSMYVCLTLTIVFYSMWTVDDNIAARINSDLLIWTVPLVLIILFQYSLSVEKDSDGDPVEVIVNNKPLLVTVLVYILMIFFIWRGV